MFFDALRRQARRKTLALAALLLISLGALLLVPSPGAGLTTIIAIAATFSAGMLVLAWMPWKPKEQSNQVPQQPTPPTE